MQNGVSCSIKPQQITFIVPGVENFDHSEISQFLQKAQDNLVGFSCILKMVTVVCFLIWLVKFLVLVVQDPALLEFAWVELLEKNKSVTAEELAEVLSFIARHLSFCSFNDHTLLCR